jgi:hypothetical protein
MDSKTGAPRTKVHVRFWQILLQKSVETDREP